MPVIRLATTPPALKKEDRASLTDQLARELSGEATEGGPVIFEIPLSGGQRMDVLVVWDKWKDKDVPSPTRTDVILDAYGDAKPNVAQALGVTYREAIEQNLLPYAVVPMVRKKEAPGKALQQAMKKHGAFVVDGKVDLRLPTMELAGDVHRQLVDELPKGYWSIVHSIGSAE